MKKFIAWFLVLALTAAVSIGATLAYLTDTDEDVNVMTLGKVKIDQLEYERIDTETEDEDATVQEFHDNKPLYPAVVDKNFDWTTGDSFVNWEQIDGTGSDEIWDPANINNEVDKMVFVKNKGDYDAFVRSVIAFEAGKYETLDEFLSMVHLNINTVDYEWNWVETPVKIGENTYFVVTATYKNALKPGELTPPSLLQIALDPSATNEDVEAFGETYQVLVKSQGIQADGFDDPLLALDEGFGEITLYNLPWENDDPVKGTDLMTAIHYLNGNQSTKITTKVSNVIFALDSEYPEVIDDYKGTLVDVEQDVPVYAYYVPNGSKYDVYFLASDVIYTPKDSTGLFRGMTSLVTIDTHNMDVSRTENMGTFMYSCTKLETMDVSHWDTSNVTSMRSAFRSCPKLKEFDVSNWDVSNVTSFLGAFMDMESVTELDVGNWDTSSATDMQGMFSDCTGLTTLDLADWDVSHVTNFASMFQGDSGKADMNFVELDLSKWDTSSATDMSFMFFACADLQSLDLSNWDTAKVTTMLEMFVDCNSLSDLKVSNWDTSNVENMDDMFYDCCSLMTLDVSGWNTAKVKKCSGMFQSCSKLTTISVGDGWDMSNATSSGGMFAGCSALVGANGTTISGNPQDAAYARVDTPETPGYLTHINNKPVTNP